MAMTTAPAPVLAQGPAPAHGPAPAQDPAPAAGPAPAGPGPADIRGRVAELHAIREAARLGPGEKATAAQHAKGKLTARERIALLLDDGSFQEVEQLRRHRATGFGLEAKKPYTDGVVTGWGTVEGRT
ncbi:carboxyl transferase domain-containing protein, partial [Streptomyces olivochromogenes]|uniref:carboxyl transferase domain-containing protein n=1 Tax=Streptomyces olivochromogenes TaxID=1963 RepID=UPI003683E704